MSLRLPLLITIVGPTASGKSALALNIADSVDAEIVNVDSLQLYRDLNIGTGKPSAEEMARVPHHLIGILSLQETYSAGRIVQDARAAIETITRRKTALAVGGTGFYYHSTLYGLSEAPSRIDALRIRLDKIASKRGNGCLFRILARVDPESARRIMPHDRVRLIRSLEVYFGTGSAFSRFRAQPDQWLSRFRWVGLGLMPERHALYSRINDRVQEMLRRGWIDEVRALLQAGADPSWKAFDAIGYREIVQFCRNETTFDQMTEAIRRRTRNYAKRQITWFRKEPDIVWMEGFGDEPRILEQSLKFVVDRETSNL